jgi:hypothetical protein
MYLDRDIQVAELELTLSSGRNVAAVVSTAEARSNPTTTGFHSLRHDKTQQIERLRAVRHAPACAQRRPAGD